MLFYRISPKKSKNYCAETSENRNSVITYYNSTFNSQEICIQELPQACTYKYKILFAGRCENINRLIIKYLFEYYF